MLRWALDLVLERGDHSWSMENVSTPTTRAVLAEYAARFPGRVGFATLDAAEFGAAQTRIRLIAAPPKLIKLLQEMPSARRVSVRQAFANQGLEVPAPTSRTRRATATACRACAPWRIRASPCARHTRSRGAIARGRPTR